MAVQGINGLAVGAAAAGVLLVWSGLKGAKVTTAVRSLASGQQPTGGALPITSPAASPAAGPTGAAGEGSGGPLLPAEPVGPLQAYAEAQLIAHGWPGQFPALNSIVMAESSWRTNARNPSGAYGIAQALGHGTAATAGSQANEYGNYGTPDSVCRAANSGSGTAQIDWMLNYIGQAYGSPNAAWMFHQAHGSY